jgi:hypothetical protein
MGALGGIEGEILFRMTTRPNPILAPAAIYDAKTSRWAAQWPQLKVLPWLTSDRAGSVG